MLGEIKVVNIKKFDDKEHPEAACVNIMRPNPLGNPFFMDGEEQREIVIRKFYHYLRKEYAKKDTVYNELMKLVEILKSGKDVYLICCCAPKLCHGNIIQNAVEGIIRNESKKKN
jgi:hypothetical protein